MQVSISDPVTQTSIFIALLLVAVVGTMRKRAVPGSLDIGTTQELKGFAILAIVFAHIGYYLAADHSFLFPISVLAGVGVDLFLFISGFGITTSALSRELSISQFYRRRLKKIYIPLWTVLVLFFATSFFLLHVPYDWSYITHSFFGWFPHANLYSDVNSPLWYISLILFYYLLFPLLFSKRAPYLSALAIYAVSYGLTIWTPVGLREQMPLYESHLLAFPLGMLAAWLVQGRKSLPAIKNTYLHYAIFAVLLAGIAYLSIHSGVGKEPWVADRISMLTVALIIAVFVIKKFDVRLFSLFGIFSFEVYLLHWPILYRYDILFTHLPASAALAAYLALFIGLAWVLQRVHKKVEGSLDFPVY